MMMVCYKQHSICTPDIMVWRPRRRIPIKSDVVSEAKERILDSQTIYTYFVHYR
jgi:hypothetical protein